MSPSHPRPAHWHRHQPVQRHFGRRPVSAGESWLASLGVRFYVGLTVGLMITDNKVRAVAIQLGKDIIGAVL